jgi:hypothetical protein
VDFWRASWADLETKGYSPLHEHRVAGLAFGLFVVAALVLRHVTSPDSGAEFPTIGYVYILVGGWCSVFAALTFFFDRYHVPSLILALGLAMLWPPGRHAFEVVAWGESLETAPQIPLEDAAVTLSETHSLRAAPPLPTPEEQFRARFEGGGPITVVAAAGGGIQAAAWTTRALAGLQSAYPEFLDSVALISGASGGSVGTYFWLEGLRRKLGEKGCPARAALNEDVEWSRQAHCAARAPSLQASAWGTALADGFPILGHERDRAWAIETAWLKNLDAYVPAKDESLHRTQLSEWAHLANEGCAPGIVFNATIVETGELLTLSNLDWLPMEDFQSLSRAYPRKKAKEKQAEGADTIQQIWDTSAVSAARLSATFPYVTPVATARRRGHSRPDFDGHKHVADGGLFDNQGVVAGVHYLQRLMAREGEPTRMLLGDDSKEGATPRQVLFLLLDGYPEEPDAVVTDPGTFNQLSAPPKTLWNARGRTQQLRASMELSLLTDYALTRNVQLTVVTLRPPQLEGKEQIPPLSWQLDCQSICRLDTSWDRALEQARADLDPLFDPRDPESTPAPLSAACALPNRPATCSCQDVEPVCPAPEAN